MKPIFYLAMKQLNTWQRKCDVNDNKSNDDDDGNSNHAYTTAKKMPIVSTTLIAVYKEHTDMVQLI